MTEIEKLLKEFYLHFNGVDDYGCVTCKKCERDLEQYVKDKTERYEERLATQKGIILNHVEQEMLHKQYVIKARIEELESFKWKPRESWEDDVVRHNGQIDSRIAELKKGLK